MFDIKNGKSIVNYNAEKTGKTETKNGAQVRATQHVDNRKKHMMAFYISTVEINFNSERKKSFHCICDASIYGWCKIFCDYGIRVSPLILKFYRSIMILNQSTAMDEYYY